MLHDFPYLKDSAFLKAFDEIKLKQQFVKIIILDFDENPIEEIQGKAVGGSFSLDGSSAMRRTGTINLIADDYENNLTTTRNLLSINKKVEILVGFTNITNKYNKYDILWFPMGVYVIIAPNISHGQEGISISLTLHDKMALLNGECGGVLPASVTFNQIEDINEKGEIEILEPTIYQIIQQLVNHFGGEQLGKIIISDVDDRIKKVMKWTGSSPLYLYRTWDSQGGFFISHFTTNYEEVQNQENIEEFTYGDDIGYILTDFVYPGELIGNAGDSVVTILDQIRDTLGNYEYFYDVNGNFRFQEIKNYLNTSYSTFEINETNLENYLVDYTSGKSVYNFEDANIIISYSNAPQFQQIKNDFLVWGKKKTASGNEYPIRYHLAIDKKPETGNEYKVFFFTDPDDGIVKAKRPLKFSSLSSFPEQGLNGVYYLAEDTNYIYKWDAKYKDYEKTTYTLETVTSNDYRTELYLSGVAHEPFGLDSNYYYTELKNEWPKIYDIKGNPPNFKEQILRDPSSMDFFLDFIDTPTALSEFSVNNIGRRTTVLVDDSINCLFEPTYPNIVLIEAGSADVDKIRNECYSKRQEYSQVRTEIYSMLMVGGTFKSAYEEIRKELYQYTNYNEQVSLTTLPIYYLEPNTRITIRDNQSGIYGDYMINTISLPLDSNGTMSISCTKAFERI